MRAQSSSRTDSPAETDRQSEGRPTGAGEAARGIELGPLADNVGFHLRLAAVAAERELKGIYGEDMRLGYFPVLMLIRLNPEATQSAIAEAVGLRRSSLVPILKRLERFGWIERTGNAGDKRANLIRLTPNGRRACDEIGRYVEQIEAKMHGALGARGYERLVELLRKLEDLFDEPGRG